MKGKLEHPILMGKPG